MTVDQLRGISPDDEDDEDDDEEEENEEKLDRKTRIQRAMEKFLYNHILSEAGSGLVAGLGGAIAEQAKQSRGAQVLLARAQSLKSKFMAFFFSSKGSNSKTSPLLIRFVVFSTTIAVVLAIANVDVDSDD
mmetsp:Transcript_59/g.105  ORF Transcript_59/g.105 Transcript_59/m.105 type:complete len:131 (+) Transcript_59:27-419(+)